MLTRSAQQSVHADLSYLRPMVERAVQTMYDPGPGSRATNCIFDLYRCQVTNARACDQVLRADRLPPPEPFGTLDTRGFMLLDAPSVMTEFHDEDAVVRHYYPEIEALALALTAGIEATVFDHLVRRCDEGGGQLGIGRPGDGTRPGAVGHVHNDYTETSGQTRRHAINPRRSEAPFMILNFWRPVAYPVENLPLALCDCRSFSKADWVDCEIVYPHRTGEIYLGRHAEAHRWYYYPDMQPSELLVFKTYDSRRDLPARMTPHCAFNDVNAPADARPRQSIEIRCLVLLE